jgi:hypothetical protein
MISRKSFIVTLAIGALIVLGLLAVGTNWLDWRLVPNPAPRY